MTKKETLHRNLIPYNIVLSLVAFFAILSLLFMPILTVNLKQLMMGLIDTTVNESEAESGFSEEDEYILNHFDININFTAASFAEITFDKNPGAKILTQYVFGKGNVLESEILLSLASVILDENGTSTDYIYKLDLTSANDVFYSLEKTEADPVAAAKNYVDKLNTELSKYDLKQITDTSAAEELFTEIYDRVCEKTDGKFSVESLVCISMFGDAENPPSNYYEVATYIVDTDFADESDDFFVLILSLLSMLGGYIKYVFYVMLLLILPWIFLLFFSLLHILIPNKKLSIWYIEAFGSLPTALFWLLPLGLRLILRASFPPIAAVLGAMSSYAWISGICFLVVTILDRVWASPIRRRIKDAEKAEKAEMTEKKN